ncbi:MAG TPA: methyltransferase, partial [Candidatus Limiplasma sp.]|nr:methyltransferase [Candidatus Limiplasma sp.]
PTSFETHYRGQTLRFETDRGVFSRLEMDRGTEVLLDALPEGIGGRVLDMGCGYGALGVSLGKANPTCALTMVDINERAVSLARENAKRNGVAAETLVSDGYAALAGRVFDLIVTNPPIRAGKRVIYRMFADGAAALAEGGAMVLVIRKQQGAPSAKAYLETLFKRVQVTDRSGGFWVLRCEQPQAARVGESDTDE